MLMPGTSPLNTALAFGAPIITEMGDGGAV